MHGHEWVTLIISSLKIGNVIIVVFGHGDIDLLSIL